VEDIFLYILLKSWSIGLAVAAPVGPIGVMCVRKTFELGLKGTVAVGLGASTADTFYGCIALLAFLTGMSTIPNFLLQHEPSIKIIGGIFLLFLAYLESKQKTREQVIDSNGDMVDGSIRPYNFLYLIYKTFFLTLANPLTILGFIGVFAAFSCTPTSWMEFFIMLGGVFVGSMSWWMFLGGGALIIRKRTSVNFIDKIKGFAVAIILVSAVCAIISGIAGLCQL